MPQSTILTVNTGSSSVRLSAFDADHNELRPIATERLEAQAGAPEELLRAFLQSHDLKTITIASHRIAHGGAHFTAPTRLDAEAERAIGELSHLAPLHNPRALR